MAIQDARKSGKEESEIGVTLPRRTPLCLHPLTQTADSSNFTPSHIDASTASPTLRETCGRADRERNEDRHRLIRLRSTRSGRSGLLTFEGRRQCRIGSAASTALLSHRGIEAEEEEATDINGHHVARRAKRSLARGSGLDPPGFGRVHQSRPAAACQRRSHLPRPASVRRCTRLRLLCSGAFAGSTRAVPVAQRRALRASLVERASAQPRRRLAHLVARLSPSLLRHPKPAVVGSSFRLVFIGRFRNLATIPPLSCIPDRHRCEKRLLGLELAQHVGQHSGTNSALDAVIDAHVGLLNTQLASLLSLPSPWPADPTESAATLARIVTGLGLVVLLSMKLSSPVPTTSLTPHPAPTVTDLRMQLSIETVAPGSSVGLNLLQHRQCKALIQNHVLAGLMTAVFQLLYNTISEDASTTESSSWRHPLFFQAVSTTEKLLGWTFTRFDPFSSDAWQQQSRSQQDDSVLATGVDEDDEQQSGTVTSQGKKALRPQYVSDAFVPVLLSTTSSPSSPQPTASDCACRETASPAATFPSRFIDCVSASYPRAASSLRLKSPNMCLRSSPALSTSAPPSNPWSKKSARPPHSSCLRAATQCSSWRKPSRSSSRSFRCRSWLHRSIKAVRVRKVASLSFRRSPLSVRPSSASHSTDPPTRTRRTIWRCSPKTLSTSSCNAGKH